ncbi:MAG: Rieske 2Fe-2S domain-containing protein [Phycisphaeraceae bacterium]|nr:Rieske 2Fe-2S domain-containing protein [Phycisphaerae bacterium]MBX3392032.1 Rieske 2Fe-2S domain-containing protein [Phycisphaeraceae bacterium]
MATTPDRLKPFEINPDIARAATLPARVYSDESIYRAMVDRVLPASWQFIGDNSLVKTPGQVSPVTLLEGSLDEPLLLTRDLQDRVHALSNVCTHRGTTLVEKGGHEKRITCRYHGRRFELDGTCRFMPEFQGVEGFPSPSDHLPRVPFGTFPIATIPGNSADPGAPDAAGMTGSIGRFLFASIRPAGPLVELLADMQRRVGWMPFDRFTHDPSRSREYLVRANWALYCDNYLEGFHIPFVHTSLNQALDYGEYSTELFPWSNLQLGIATSGEDAFDLPTTSPDHGRRVAAYYFWLFPNTMFNFYPWGLSINVVRPVGVSLTKVAFISYVWDESRLDRGAGAGLDRVEREDEAVVEAVQQGTRSRLYDRGRYSPTREQGVHHFHTLLARRFFETPPVL